MNGTIIKKQREQRGWEYSDLAEMLGVKAEEIYEWENSQCEISELDISLLAAKFEMPEKVLKKELGYYSLPDEWKEENVKAWYRLSYNPYTNRVNMQTLCADHQDEKLWLWKEVSTGYSNLEQFMNKDVLFSNCVYTILKELKKKNSDQAGDIRIFFEGPDEDFRILCRTAVIVEEESKDEERFKCKQISTYWSADEALEEIKAGYNELSSEFKDYLPGECRYVGDGVKIGDLIARFNEITANEIPICIIGNYSVGKSAFINALIGDEILPSKVQASTAKNVKLICADHCSVNIEYKPDTQKGTICIKMEITDGDIAIEESYLGEAEKEVAQQVCETISSAINAKEKNCSQIIHDILGFLNENSADIMQEQVGCNVTVEIPFKDSVLTQADATVVFYDTPGSNNSNVQQAAHKDALKKMMKEQTNALPILLCTIETIMSDDMRELRKLLDEFKENFSCPNSLIVISKGDNLIREQLEEPLSDYVLNWYGRSTILFVTPIGAIGERKQEKDQWIDQSYRDIYKMWKLKEKDEQASIILPEYNVSPCKGRTCIDVRSKVSKELYQTGIASLEAEILYYIQSYANYKKCIRGREELLQAFAGMRTELARKKEQKRAEEQEAARRKRAERDKLTAQINAIEVPDIRKFALEISEKYSEKLDTYCQSVPDAMDAYYDECYDDMKRQIITDQFNKRLKKHCQEKLIDPCYNEPDGIKDVIYQKMEESMILYAKNLQEIVDKHAERLTQSALADLKHLFETQMPLEEIHDVRGIIEMVMEWGEMAKFQLLSLANKKDEEKLKRKWIESRAKSFEKSLKGSKGFLGNPGMFHDVAVKAPLTNYYKELKIWKTRYRKQVLQMIDKENAILSGCEEEIQRLDAEIGELSSSLGKLSDREKILGSLFEMYQ